MYTLMVAKLKDESPIKRPNPPTPPPPPPFQEKNDCI